MTDLIRKVEKALIDNILNQIKNHSGLELSPCDYFTGFYNYNGDVYFNALLKSRIFYSTEYLKLQKLSTELSSINKVEQNGLYRVAITIK